MRRKLSAGVLMALVFLIPAAPAVAETKPPVLNAACQTVEPTVYKDIRTLVTIDLDSATDVQVRVLASQILFEANAESLPVLPGALQKQLDSTPDDLRAFLKTDLPDVWTTGLRVAVVQTLTGAGTNVKTAAQKALDAGTVDAYLAYLNDGIYPARALDCAAKSTAPTASASASAGAIPSSSASPATSAGAGGALPVTGDATATAAGVGGALLLIGGAAYLMGRRRRSRFVA